LPDELSDEQLLARAVRGDHEAFAILYDRRQGAIYRFSLQMTGSLDGAEDVTQQTFVTFARELSRFDPTRGTVAGFLYGIARMLILRRAERNQQAVSDQLIEVEAEEAGPLTGLIRSEAVETVRRAVLALPSRYREAVVLCDLQELSYAEAAAIIGCPVGTVRSKLNRGRALLAGKLRAAKGCFA